MFNRNESLPSPGKISVALSELDVPTAEHAALAAQLAAWSAPTPTPAETSALVAQLSSSLLALSPVRRALRDRSYSPGSRFHMLLNLARSQTGILRPSFWLLSAVFVVLGALLVLNANVDKTLVLLALGPLLSYIATISAFRGIGLYVLEVELACPPTLRQLTLARLVIVLGYDILLGTLLSVVLWTQGGVGLMTLILHWLAPLLLVAGATLWLSIQMPIQRAAGVAYGIWLAILAFSWLVNATVMPPFLYSAQTEIILGLIGLGFLIAALRYSVYALPHFLPHRQV